MAENNQSQPQQGFFTRLMRTANAADPYIDTGLAGGMAWLGYRMLGRKGSLSNFGGATSPELIGPKLGDEANFQRLLLYISTAGGARGAYCSGLVRALAAYLAEKNTTFAEQFRNILFAELEPKTAVTRLDNLFGKINFALDDGSKWHTLMQSNDMIVQKVLSIALDIESRLSVPGITQRIAVETVAEEMITYNELPGSFLIKTEEKFEHWTQIGGEVLRECMEESRLKETRRLEQRYTPWWWIKAAFIAGIVIFALSIIYNAATRPYTAPQTNGKYTIQF